MNSCQCVRHTCSFFLVDGNARARTNNIIIAKSLQAFDNTLHRNNLLVTYVPRALRAETFSCKNEMQQIITLHHDSPHNFIDVLSSFIGVYNLTIFTSSSARRPLRGTTRLTPELWSSAQEVAERFEWLMTKATSASEVALVIWLRAAALRRKVRV